MARRGQQKARRRRRDTRFNLLNFVEATVYGSIVTKAAFNTSLPGFFLEPTGASGRSLRDLIANPEASLDEVTQRLTSMDVIFNAVGQSIITGILFNVLNKSLSKPKRKINAGLKQLGVPVKM
jgi:hypothetical protein